MAKQAELSEVLAEIRALKSDLVKQINRAKDEIIATINREDSDLIEIDRDIIEKLNKIDNLEQRSIKIENIS